MALSPSLYIYKTCMNPETTTPSTQRISKAMTNTNENKNNENKAKTSYAAFIRNNT